MEHNSRVLAPGSELGKYQVVRHLASGGMAEIYLAKTSGLEGFEKTVVLKRILPEHASNPNFVAMFLDEARIAATLNHPNIAQTYDIGHDGGSYFFTMEYVHGRDLRAVIRAAESLPGKIPLGQAVSIALGMCSGLHYAHEKNGADGQPLGIVHRDVSPSNVLVTYDGAVKVVDFGIAKASTQQSETRTGTFKGKMYYLSPEQCTQRPIDRRSDVFAIGIVLYEMTTGTRCFSGDNDLAVLHNVVYEPIDLPSRRRADYPPELERIVLRALARDPNDRYPTAQDLHLDLEDFARHDRLVLSTVVLARLMRELFGPPPDVAQIMAAAPKRTTGPRQTFAAGSGQRSRGTASNETPTSAQHRTANTSGTGRVLDYMPTHPSRPVAKREAFSNSTPVTNHTLAGESQVRPFATPKKRGIQLIVGVATASAIAASAVVMMRSSSEDQPTTQSMSSENTEPLTTKMGSAGSTTAANAGAPGAANGSGSAQANPNSGDAGSSTANLATAGSATNGAGSNGADVKGTAPVTAPALGTGTNSAGKTKPGRGKVASTAREDDPPFIIPTHAFPPSDPPGATATAATPVKPPEDDPPVVIKKPQPASDPPASDPPKKTGEWNPTSALPPTQ